MHWGKAPGKGLGPGRGVWSRGGPPTPRPPAAPRGPPPPPGAHTAGQIARAPPVVFRRGGPKPREAPPATRGPMHPRRRILLRQNDRPGLPMTRCYLRSAICRWAPQPSRPSLSGGTHYVTPPPCEDEGQNPGKNLGNSRSGRFSDSSIFPDGMDAHYRSGGGGETDGGA